jgi:hypothetical protein
VGGVTEEEDEEDDDNCSDVCISSRTMVLFYNQVPQLSGTFC